jgi:hypothetical protein
MLNPFVKAINQDINDLFIQPTLKKIQKIARDNGVVYAEVGKVSVSGLNGIHSKVKTGTVSTFETTRPQRLDQIITNAGDAYTKINNIEPETIKSVPQTQLANGLLALASAIGKIDVTWNQLTSGISLDITPSILSDSQSAQLNIVFINGGDPDNKSVDPDFSSSISNEKPLPQPPSRISQNTVNTNVYVNTWDLFALSTFDSQTTVDGGRTPIFVIGDIWKGIFGSIPVFGDLFSLPNGPKNVQHQSIVLTNTFIVPTAMGLSHLYDDEEGNERQYSYQALKSKIEKFLERTKKEFDLQQNMTNPDNKNTREILYTPSKSP